MINFEQYLIERKGSVVIQPQPKRKVKDRAELNGIIDNGESLMNLDLSSVKDLSFLFFNKEYDGTAISTWTFAKGSDMSWMFARAQNNPIEGNNQDKIHLIGLEDCNCESMFNSNTSIEEVYISGSVMECDNMFLNCKKLKTVNKFDTSKSKGFMAMFSGCKAIKDVPLYDLSSATIVTAMFMGCSELRTDLHLLDVTDIVDMHKARMVGGKFYSDNPQFVPKGYKV